ncbi:MAG: hypothetical protein ACI82A_001456 [Candidatus Azotimanducaceae bacterium]|jgi:uncharacterized protein (TIGR00299 family) protein
MHLHLDLVGGISGDMFIAAALDCFPDMANELSNQIDQAGFPDLVRLESGPFNDGVLSGFKFNVIAAADSDGHHHRHYSDIKSLLSQSELDQQTKRIALGIFKLIAEAEATIHDKHVEEVAFHEVGAWDSIADIVCASYLIGRLRIESSSCSALPLGGGRVKTAHGLLPLPAPATALILKGFEFVDDGISGERITPTGAAILKFLNPGQRPRGRLVSQGFGFGNKQFPGISNTLRLLVMEPMEQMEPKVSADEKHWETETIHQLEFEIDDQTPEQLAAAITRLQAMAGVLDIVQYGVYGKKNRLSHAVRVLSDGQAIDQLVSHCFSLTTTLGLRHSQPERHLLRREATDITIDDKAYRVKVAARPGGKTAKTEMDDLTQLDSVAEQADIRRQLESSALNEKDD